MKSTDKGTQNKNDDDSSKKRGSEGLVNILFLPLFSLDKENLYLCSSLAQFINSFVLRLLSSSSSLPSLWIFLLYASWFGSWTRRDNKSLCFKRRDEFFLPCSPFLPLFKLHVGLEYSSSSPPSKCWTGKVKKGRKYMCSRWWCCYYCLTPKFERERERKLRIVLFSSSFRFK